MWPVGMLVPMAFDGPGPFDGDPVCNYRDLFEQTSPEQVRATLSNAFDAVLQPNSHVAQALRTFASMTGAPVSDPDEAELPRSETYDVDETVFAWAAAELVALALGRPSKPPPPQPFASAAAHIPEAVALVPKALAALDVVADASRSEVAALWNQNGRRSLADHLAPLRKRLWAR